MRVCLHKSRLQAMTPWRATAPSLWSLLFRLLVQFPVPASCHVGAAPPSSNTCLSIPRADEQVVEMRLTQRATGESQHRQDGGVAFGCRSFHAHSRPRGGQRQRRSVRRSRARARARPTTSLHERAHAGGAKPTQHAVPFGNPRAGVMATRRAQT